MIIQVVTQMPVYGVKSGLCDGEQQKQEILDRFREGIHMNEKKREYEINWPHVILVGAIAVVLVLIGVVIGVNIGARNKSKPVPVTGSGYTWSLQPGAEAQMIYANFWQFAKASYVLVGDIPNCEFYKIVKEVPRNDFQTDNFSIDEGDESTRMYYHADDGSKLSELAVDVSSYQSALDWVALKQAGVTIAFIRAGYRGYGAEGKLVTDEMFQTHIEAAKAAGMKVGIYFYSQALNYDEGVAEAQYALNLVREYALDMPIAIDTEEVYADGARTADLTNDARTDGVVGFCETVKNAGYTPMIYSNRNWFVQKLDMTRLGSYKLWLAHYANQPDFPYLYSGWQYTGTGKISGIDQDLDLNVWMEGSVY